jgi:hypothetical protein
MEKNLRIHTDKLICLKCHHTFIPLFYHFCTITGIGNSSDKKLKESIKSTTQYFQLPRTEQGIDKLFEQSSSTNDTQVKFSITQFCIHSTQLLI